MTVPTVQVRDVADVDRPWLRELVASLWGLPVVTAVRAYEDPQRLDGVIAEVDGEPVGAVTFHVDGPEWEVVTVNAVRSGVGAGRAMLEGLRRRAKAAGASRVWLITTDTNDGAIGFYEHLGMRRVRLHRRFIDVVRAAKPDVDEGAFCNAIEFEWRIGLGSASDHSAALTLESLRLVADPSARLPRPRTEEQELLRKASTRQVPRTRAALPAVVPPMR